MRRALKSEVDVQWKRRHKKTWLKQVEEKHTRIGLSREDLPGLSKWIVDVIRSPQLLCQCVHPHLLRMLPDSKHWLLTHTGIDYQ